LGPTSAKSAYRKGIGAPKAVETKAVARDRDLTEALAPTFGADFGEVGLPQGPTETD